jgi:putative endonuclease
MKNYYIYILSNKRNDTLYIGVASNLIKRIQEHKNKLVDGFTKKYNVDKLVYYEQAEQINSALFREKALKKWNRKWKINLIEKENPNWNDLYDSIIL